MKRFRAAVFFALPIFFSSCATAPGITGGNIIAQETPDDEEILAEAENKKEEETESRHILKFTGRGIKCEIEDMVLECCEITDDENASGQKSVRMGTKSKAGVDINFPSGRFEILFSQKAYQTPGSRFYAIVDGKRYRCNPSEPPLGTWELTVRTPVVLEIPEPATVSISIECDGSYAYSWDFFLDYMQAVKIGEIVQ